jgi:hypothetical protein
MKLIKKNGKLKQKHTTKLIKKKSLLKAKYTAEATKDRIKAYREANREKRKAQKKSWYAANKIKVKAYCRANKDKRRVYEANRRALKFRATIRLTELDKFVIEEIYNLAKVRTEQIGFDWHVDHIIPLSKGGLHKPTNLQVVPATWNLQKNNNNQERWNG